MQLRDKTVLIVGLGRSGIAAARLCLTQGARVMGTDTRAEKDLPAAVRELGIELFVGGHDAVPFERAELVVVSPGVPQLPQLEQCERRGSEVIGELELGYRFCSAPVLAVGGTNGKTTTTTLLAELLKAEGLKVFAGGNLGVPLCEVALEPHDALVLEVSSFQLERAPTFKPRVSVLLNITDDHLDRYAGFEDYARAKGNAFARQDAQDFAVIPAGDAICAAQARRGNGRLVTFGFEGSGGESADYQVAEGKVLIPGQGEVFDLQDAELQGRHNWLNAAAAIAAARCHGISPGAIEKGLRVFRPLPHRMALAGVVAGVSYYDDSKGTNVGAAVTAIGGIAEPRVVLVAGGRDKHGSYEPLRAALAAKGRAAVLIGEAAERLAAALQDTLPVQRAGSMDEAVQIAAKLAQTGDAVLLSPACSSFDMFSGYAARGEAFSEAVQRLKRAEKA